MRLIILLAGVSLAAGMGDALYIEICWLFLANREFRFPMRVPERRCVFQGFAIKM